MGEFLGHLVPGGAFVLHGASYAIHSAKRINKCQDLVTKYFLFRSSVCIIFLSIVGYIQQIGKPG